jgi:hypothetical protein
LLGGRHLIDVNIKTESLVEQSLRQASQLFHPLPNPLPCRERALTFHSVALSYPLLPRWEKGLGVEGEKTGNTTFYFIAASKS